MDRHFVWAFLVIPPTLFLFAVTLWITEKVVALIESHYYETVFIGMAISLTGLILALWMSFRDA